ncbi:MAG: PspC domain-containing protein, partial [Firmicutes bacterium]|nr:PspC domain-containing protein [Bacillota bacterium]
MEVLLVERRLYRSVRDRMLGGVCGGLARYIGTDP